MRSCLRRLSTIHNFRAFLLHETVYLANKIALEKAEIPLKRRRRPHHSLYQGGAPVCHPYVRTHAYRAVLECKHGRECCPDAIFLLANLAVQLLLADLERVLVRCESRDEIGSLGVKLGGAPRRAEPPGQVSIVRALLNILFLPGLLQIAGQIRPLGILGKDDAAKLLRALGELFLFRRVIGQGGSASARRSGAR